MHIICSIGVKVQMKAMWIFLKDDQEIKKKNFAVYE